MKNVTYINAGAGSGKTYTLTKLLSDKLSDKTLDIKPSQVILTTFTELAASEFREKARQQILEAGCLDAAAQMDSAAIGTVHSVALRFIHKFWYLLDYGADIQPISERDESFYMSQSLVRIVSEEDENGQLKRQKELDAFREFRDYYDIVNSDNKPDYHFWERYLNDIVEKMEYYNVDEVETSIEKSLETMKAVFTGKIIDKSELLKWLNSYYDHVGEIKTGRSANKANTHRKAIKPLLNCKHAYELTSLTSMLEAPAGGEDTKTKCPGYDEFMENLRQLTVSSSNLEIMEPFIKAIFNLAKEWRDDFVNYKKQKHIISYNDMERLFLQLITEKQEVIDYIRDNYRLVMVDEFQDSNPIQLKIFNRLSEIIAENDGHSYWVGDPKQAIYGFRGADAELVNSVSRQFTFYDDADIHPEAGENHLGSGRLVESWRSRPDLVNLVNEIFKDKFKDDGIDPLCITLLPHFINDDLKSKAIGHWHNPPQNGKQKNVNANSLAWKVKELLASKMLVHSGKRDEPATPIRPKDVAILCRKNEACKKIVKALRKYNIPVAEAEDAIMQRIEVQLVVALLQFTQNPNDKHTFADLMRLLWGMTPKEILRQRIDYVWEKDTEGKYIHFDDKGHLTNDGWMREAKEVLELTKLTERFKHFSIPEMVRSIIYECNIPALSAKWGDGQIRQQNLSTVQHLADDYDQMCLQMGLGTSINGFIYYLNSIEPDKEKVNQSDTVKVLTYHSSKGLEWPVVIMCELNENTLENKELIKKSFMRVREMVLSDQDAAQDPFAKEYIIHLFPINFKESGPNVTAPQELTKKIVQLPLFENIKKRVTGEEKRLLYVGMTRAKDCLITTGINDEFAWLTNVGIEGIDKNHVWGQGLENISQEINVPDDEEETKSPTYTLVQKPDTHDTRDKRYLSPSKLPKMEFAPEDIEILKDLDCRIEPYKTSKENQAEAGTCIHNIFAVYDSKLSHEVNVEKAEHIRNNSNMQDVIPDADKVIVSIEYLYAYMKQNYGDANEIKHETPFIYSLCGQAIRGEIDLIWMLNDKECVLVDFKNFPGSKATIKDSNPENEHYAGNYASQLKAYCDVLTQSGLTVRDSLIYYSVMGCVVRLNFR